MKYEIDENVVNFLLGVLGRTDVGQAIGALGQLTPIEEAEVEKDDSEAA